MSKITFWFRQTGLLQQGLKILCMAVIILSNNEQRRTRKTLDSRLGNKT